MKLDTWGQPAFCQRIVNQMCESVLQLVMVHA